MTKVLRGSRVKGLPPKVQLQIKDAATGSYPSTFRVVSDNRTGKYNVSYDDQKTINFTTFSSSLPEPLFYYKLDSSFVSASRTYTPITTGSVYVSGTFPMMFISGASISTTAVPYNVNGNNPGSLYLVSSSGDHTMISGSHVISSSFTVACWMKLNSDPGGNLYSIFGKSNPDNLNKLDFGAVCGFGNVLAFFIGDAANSQTNNVGCGVDFATSNFNWTHVAFSYNFGGTSYTSIKIWVNGINQATQDLSNGTFVSPSISGSNLIMLGKGGFLNSGRIFDGFLDEFVIFNKVLTDSEVAELYNARYDYYKAGKINAGIQLNPENTFWGETSEYHTDIFITGKTTKGVSDTVAHFTPGQYFTPFRDNSNPGSDGKSFISGTTAQQVFFATGSKIAEVGEGFDQPLWSKSKIEIDLTPSVAHAFSMQNYQGSDKNYPMAYWNNDRKVWEGIGLGKEFSNYLTASSTVLDKFLEQQTIGFGQGVALGSGGTSDYSAGAKISNFGFPYHVKYHATSSQCISMSNYIQEPFLLEKIVLEFSGGFNYNTNTYYGNSVAYSVNTFFILNQRSPFSYSDPSFQSFTKASGAVGNTYTVTTGVNIPDIPPGQTATVNTIRDLVTHAQIAYLSTATAASTRGIITGSKDLVIDYNDPLVVADGIWSGKIMLSGTVKEVLPNDGLGACSIGNATLNESILLINKYSGRSGLFVPSGRDLVGSLERGQQIDRSALFSGFSNNGPTSQQVVLNRYSKTNPYLLLPGDKLVLGWQLPLSTLLNLDSSTKIFNGKGFELTFAQSPAKITLYGSLVREGREAHDTLNQLLSSPSIHEVIE